VGGVALRLLLRDWRAGELRLLLAALVVAVATVSGIDLFVDRLKGALYRESAQLLGGDAAIGGSQPLPDAWRPRAEALGLRTAATLTFTSMVFAGDASQLVAAKAVDPAYPLRGQLITSDEAFGRGVPTAAPAPGEVWLDSRMLPALGVRIGDRIAIGVAELTLTRVLIAEPDRGSSFYDLGPRLLMNLADVPATRVVQPGSRVSHGLLLGGDAAALAAFRAGIQAELAPHFRWRGVREGSQAVGSALDRAESFLLLGGLLGVLLAGVAVALAAHRYARRHYEHVAVLKTLGLGPRRIRHLYGTMLLGLGTAGAVLGCLCGFGVHVLIVGALSQLMPVDLPPAGWQPYVTATVTGFVCLASFALPPVLKLQAVSPMRVVRGDVRGDVRVVGLSYAAAAAGCLGLLIWYSRSLSVTLWVISGAAAIACILLGGAWLLLRGGRVAGMHAGKALHLGLASLRRRGWQNAVQIMIFAFAIMLGLVLVLVRTGLLDTWRAQLPDGAPNHFVMNIVAEEVDQVRSALVAHTGESPVLFPMLRGRIVRINGESVRAWAARHAQDDGTPRPGARGERNLTWSRTLPAGNRVVAGDWWPGDTMALLASVDEDYARESGLGVGDVLTFAIIDREVDVTISNLRRVDWDSMRPNFFVVFSPGVLADLPVTYMTSFHLPVERKRFLNDFLARFPTVSVLEVDALIAQVKAIVDRVIAAVELVLGLVLVAGGLVLVAAVMSSLDERVREHALLRTLGARRSLVVGALAAEFCTLGAFAGLLAAVGAQVSVYTLEAEVFGLGHSVHPLLFVVGPLGGIGIVATLGLWATRRVVSTPPGIVLRAT
jgi:putative ABC transport system permease protein